MSLGAIILAAGTPKDGERFQPMMSVGRKPCVQRVADVLLEARISPIVVVTGYYDEHIRRILADRKLTVIRNRRYAESEMIDSVRIALSALKGSCSRVMIVPGDMPLLRKSTISQLARSEGDFCIPCYREKPGHPVVISEAIIAKIEGSDGDDGLDALAKQLNIAPTFIPVDDAGVLLDINTDEQYNVLMEQYSKLSGTNRLRVESGIRLVSDDTVLDADIAALLKMIDYTGSIQIASEYVGIHYSKAWRQISNLEDRLGIKITESSIGGKKGGGTKLTERGRALMELFSDLEKEGSRLLNLLYKEYNFDEFVQK
ncbi:MAG: NTP transferase domain-containing protein [Oscillospiraceae bacterium]|nr:NTP transferase domain-containing protein [Oscillospiraceae bacterium]